jgi:peptidoglycan/xylan/chitin deacetylase (PgdA/CDA1 family)
MPELLTILNYHYVRPLSRTRYPAINGCDVEIFVSQLDFLTDNYSIMSMSDLIGHLGAKEPLPPRAALLSFDDGFADHFDYVLPLLYARDLTGCFYPPAAPVLEHRLLDVHKIHFLLAGGPEISTICNALNELVLEQELGDIDEFASLFRHPSPRDSAEIIYVKRMLQKGLPPNARKEISSILFERFISVDERAFAEELYCSLDQLRLMAALNMHIGSHGYEHLWLSTLDPEHQRSEMIRSVEFLDLIYDQSISHRTICYPYGDHSDITLQVAKEVGFVLGLADHHGIANLLEDDLWALPRVSTSDFLIS